MANSHASGDLDVAPENFGRVALFCIAVAEDGKLDILGQQIRQL